MTKRKTESESLDDPDQAIDTPLPSDRVDEEVFAAMAEEYEGDPEEVDGQVDEEEDSDG